MKNLDQGTIEANVNEGIKSGDDPANIDAHEKKELKIPRKRRSKKVEASEGAPENLLEKDWTIEKETNAAEKIKSSEVNAAEDKERIKAERLVEMEKNEAEKEAVRADLLIFKEREKKERIEMAVEVLKEKQDEILNEAIEIRHRFIDKVHQEMVFGKGIFGFLKSIIFIWKWSEVHALEEKDMMRYNELARKNDALTDDIEDLGKNSSERIDIRVLVLKNFSDPKDLMDAEIGFKEEKVVENKVEEKDIESGPDDDNPGGFDTTTNMAEDTNENSNERDVGGGSGERLAA